MTPPEVRLWGLLRRSPAGIRFRRQHAIGGYVADFYCPAARLVIEVDGQIHDSADAVARDDVRDHYLRGLGLQVVRIRAADVLADPTGVADSLTRLCGPSTTQHS
ncbi:endonuclease domain-containing protein [Sphingomonas sp.]|uniref:endonuclease domain-containing protein n=1 Tax=Sphingomonas sp. TaxID=28214 RepID=UPI0025F71933|nr:endonuclease domain-containing protein [Sphingomonas sp.]